MYLSNRDIKWAIECGKLIVDPAPTLEQGYDETSIDLHLGPVKDACIWDVEPLVSDAKSSGQPSHDGAPEIHLGSFEWKSFAEKRLMEIPREDKSKSQLVFRRGDDVVIRKFGFLLWPTKERVGTPRIDPLSPTKVQRPPELICFVNAKSTKARTGLLVHFTAPTIHAGWDGNITLEISNLGPFTFILKEGDALAQLTVATISSAPDLTLKSIRSLTQGQTRPSGST